MRRRKKRNDWLDHPLMLLRSLKEVYGENWRETFERKIRENARVVTIEELLDYERDDSQDA